MKKLLTILAILIAFNAYSQNTTQPPSGLVPFTSFSYGYKLGATDSTTNYWFYNNLLRRWNRFYSATEVNNKFYYKTHIDSIIAGLISFTGEIVAPSIKTPTISSDGALGLSSPYSITLTGNDIATNSENLSFNTNTATNFLGAGSLDFYNTGISTFHNKLRAGQAPIAATDVVRLTDVYKKSHLDSLVAGLIPIPYLPINNPAFTGVLSGPKIKTTDTIRSTSIIRGRKILGDSLQLSTYTFLNGKQNLWQLKDVPKGIGSTLRMGLYSTQLLNGVYLTTPSLKMEFRLGGGAIANNGPNNNNPGFGTMDSDYSYDLGGTYYLTASHGLGYLGYMDTVGTGNTFDFLNYGTNAISYDKLGNVSIIKPTGAFTTYGQAKYNAARPLSSLDYVYKQKADSIYLRTANRLYTNGLDYITDTTGTTDQTANLQAAINATQAGGMLQLPAGRIKSGKVTINNKITITGANGNYSIDHIATIAAGSNKYNNSGTQLLSSSTTDTAFLVKAPGCVFEKLMITSVPGGTPTTSEGIYFTNAGTFQINQCTITGFNRNAEVLNGLFWTINECVFSSMQEYGLYIHSPDVPDDGDYNISNSTFVGNTNATAIGMYIESSGGTKITNVKCVSYGTNKLKTGIELYSKGNTAQFLLSNVSSEGVTEHGIYVHTMPGSPFAIVQMSNIQIGTYNNISGHAITITGSTAPNPGGAITNVQLSNIACVNAPGFNTSGVAILIDTATNVQTTNVIAQNWPIIHSLHGVYNLDTCSTIRSLTANKGGRNFGMIAFTGVTPHLGSDAQGDTYSLSSTGILQRTAIGASGTGYVSNGTTPSWTSSPSYSTSVTTPILYGSSSSGGTLTLGSTSNATKGKIGLGTSFYDEVNNRFGLLLTSPPTTFSIGSTSTGFTYYNTSDLTNYERMRMFYSGNVFNIASEMGGTGTYRPMTFGVNTSLFTLTSSGADISRSGGVATPFTTTPTLTASGGMQSAISIIPTLTQTSTAGYRGLWIAPFESTTGSGVKYLIDAGTAGAASGASYTSKFTVDDTGIVTTSSKIISGGTIRLKSYTVSTLPTGTQGDEAYVTDATAPTYLGALTGGGSVVTPVFYNGTAWVSH